MELKLLTPEQIRMVYSRDLIPAFPDSERKPLPAILRLRDAGCYEPWGLLDGGGEIIGTCFLWLSPTPGWALGDYLCVPPDRRNGGLGAEILRLLAEKRPGRTLMGEAEDPETAPDPALAERRLNFYARNGARFADFRTEVFGMRYRIFYWADGVQPDNLLLREYDRIYRTVFSPDAHARYLRIPCDISAPPAPCVPWTE